MSDELTDKQAAFCAEYLIDLNASQAAIRAGYSADTARVIASQLMDKPHIQAQIQKLMDERSERTKVSQDYVLSVIAETIERCRQVEPVRDRKGNQIYVQGRDGEMMPAFTFNAAGVLKGAELIGRHLKMFTDVQEQKLSFTQMGQVVLVDGKTIEHDAKPQGQALTFNVGREADAPDTHH